jgi:hypothetical protein
MRNPHRLAELGATTLGVWRRPDALRLQTPDEIAQDLREGTVQAPVPGTYLNGGAEPTADQWLAIGVLASSSAHADALEDDVPISSLVAVGAGRTAARVHGMPLIDDDDPATSALDKHHHDVAVFRHLGDRHSRPLSGARATLHRHQLELDRTDVVQHSSGLFLTGHVRTLFDLTALVTHEALICAMDWALHEEHVTREQLEAFAASHKGWRSTPTFRRALELADHRAESPNESLTRLLLKPAWPQLTPQVRLYDHHGFVVARFDHADEEVRLAVESDGRLGHSGEVMRAKDDRRDRRTGSEFGYKTERVTWYDVRRRQAETRARILAVRDARRATRRAA